MTATDAERCIERAAAAQPEARATLPAEREASLLRLASLIEARTDEFAAQIAAEAGKPITEARGEVAYSLGFFRWFAGEARRAYGHTIPTTHSDRRLWTTRHPVGVCALIAPWNFPLAMLARKLAPAMAAGCASVLKPAEDTPLTAVMLAEAAWESGFPAEAVQLVTCGRDNVAAVGEALATSPEVRKVSFTGSTPVGKQLAEWASGTVKRVSLELGGNAPLIVFDDADLDKAAAAVVASRFRNTGQTCVCANRILVQDGVHDDFVERLLALTAELRQGDASSDAVSLGPLINPRAVEKASSFLSDAVERGASVRLGGQGAIAAPQQPRRVADAATAGAPCDGTSFFDPVVLTGATPGMLCVDEESFAPIAPVVRFGDEAEAVALANSGTAGLAAYAFTRDLGRALRVSDALEYGMVGVNEGVISTEVAPFGGVKESGLGREGGAEGLAEYTEVKYVAVGGI